MQLSKLAVGEVFSHAPSVEGMIVHFEPSREGPAMLVVLSMTRPTSHEIKSIRTGKLKFGVVQSAPLAWLTLEGEGVSFDAPYAVGIESRAQEIRASFGMVTTWTDETRSIVSVVLTDPRDRKIKALRSISLSKSFFLEAGSAVEATLSCSDRRMYDARIRSDMQRYPTTDALIRRAAYVEQGGK